jgi:hypothetical protein
MTNQLFHTWSILGEDINDYLTLTTIPHAVWAGTGTNFVYNYRTQTQHSSHHALVMETVSEPSDTNSILTWLIS